MPKSWPAPIRADHEKFCKAEGWTLVRTARGSTGTHHVTYELVLVDGRILRTRISHPPDRTTYGKSVWVHILRDQLDVDEEAFWRCARDSVAPSRGAPAPPADAVPLDLVRLLTTRVGMPESVVARMTRTEAIDAINEYWSHPPH